MELWVQVSKPEKSFSLVFILAQDPDQKNDFGRLWASIRQTLPDDLKPELLQRVFNELFGLGWEHPSCCGCIALHRCKVPLPGNLIEKHL